MAEPLQIPVIDFDEEGLFKGFDLADQFTPVKTMPDEVLRGKALELSSYRLQIEQIPEDQLPSLLQDSYNKLQLETDPERMVSMAKNAVVAQFRQKEMEALSQGVVGDITQDQAIIDEALKNSALLNLAYEGKVGSEALITDMVVPPGTNIMDVRGFAAGRLAEELGDRGILQNLWDGLSFVVPDFTWDMSDLMETGMWGSIDDFVKEVSLVQRLPPALQLNFLNERIPTIVEAFDDNAFKAAAIVHMYTDPNFDTEALLSGVLDAAFIGELAAMPLNIAADVARGVSATGRLTRLGRPDLAARVNNAIAHTAGSTDDQLTAAMNASPFNFENLIIDRGVVDGISDEGQKILRSVKQQAEARRARLSSIEFEKLSGLTPEEMAVLRETALEEYNEMIDEIVTAAPITAGRYSKAEIVQSGPEGFTIKYTMSGEDRVIPVRYGRDAVGNWVADNPEFMSPTLKSWGRRVFSPEVLLRNIDDSIVPNVTAAGNQAAIIRNALTREAKRLDHGLSLTKNHRHEVDALLLAGDEQGKVFSVGDLLNGNVEINGKRIFFTPDQAKSYYNHVNFFKELGAARNNMARQQLQFEGFKAMYVRNPQTGRVAAHIAKPVPVIDKTVKSRLKASPFVYAPQTGGKGSKIVRVSTILDGEGNINPGWQLVELREPMHLGKVKEALTDTTKQVHYAAYRETKRGTVVVDELPNTVIKFQTGYVPRVRKPGYFWVKETSGGRLRTISAFDKKVDAEEYANQLNAKAQSRKKEKFYEVFDDRQRLPGENWKDELEVVGGTLFTGSRARHRILINGSRKYVPRDTRLDAAGATQLYIENISNALPLNEYRSAMIKRYMNTVNAVAKSENSASGFSIPGDFRSELNISNVTMKRNLELVRQYMLDQLNIQSNEERAFGRAMTYLSTTMENKAVFDWKMPFVNDSIRNGVLWLSAKDPTSMLKGATFSLHLGWFNMRQFFVQAHNASLAVTAYPQHTAQVANALMMRPVVYTLAGENWRGAANLVAKAMGRDIDEYVHEFQLFKQSGLFDSITRLADYQAAVQSLTPGTFSTIQKLSRAGQIFFNEGEIMARLISFQIAKKQYMNLTGKKIMELTGKDAVEISKEALRVMLNMQKENSAWWQNAPILGNITQFMQVHAKLVEKIVGGLWQGGKGVGKGISQAEAFGGSQWTRGEAMRALGGQLLFYGTVGVPVAEEVMAYIGEVTGLSREEINPALVESVERGIVGLWTSAIGVNNNVSEDLSILSGIDDTVVVKIIKSMFVGERVDWWQTFGGPSVNAVRRGGDIFSNAIQRLNVLFHYPSSEAVGDLMIGAADDIASLTSTWNNAKKARHLAAMTTPKDIQHRLDLEKAGMYNVQTVLAKALGFQTEVENAKWRLRAEINPDIAADRKSTVDTMEKAFLLYRTTENYNSFVANMSFILEPYSEVEQIEIMEAFLNRVFPAKSELETEVGIFIKSFISSGGTRPIPAALQRLINREQE